MKSVLAFLLLVLCFGVSQAKTICHEVPSGVTKQEFDQQVDEMIKRGDIPPWNYTQPKNMKCYIEPDDGFVANKETATLVAEAIIKDNLGDSFNFKRRIFEATELPSGNWLVKAYDPSHGVRQRVPMIEINRKDARIVRLWID